jgi:hypothetical protein
VVLLEEEIFLVLVQIDYLFIYFLNVFLMILMKNQMKKIIIIMIKMFFFGTYLQEGNFFCGLFPFFFVHYRIEVRERENKIDKEH